MNKILNRLKKLYLYAGLEREDYIQIHGIYTSQNWMVLNYFSFALSLLMFGYSVYAFVNDELTPSQTTYIISFFVCITIFVINLVRAKDNLRLQKVLQLIFVASTYMMAIFNGTISDPDNLALTINVVIVVIPIVFNEKPITTIGMMLAASGTFAVFTLLFKSQSVITIDIIDIIAFSLVSLILYSSVIYTKTKGYYAQWKAIKASEDLNQAYKDLNNNYQILVSMANIYYSMHLIDLKNNTVQEFTAQKPVKEIVNHKVGINDMMVKVMKATMREDYINSVLAFTDLPTLPDRMQNKNVISGQFVGKNIGWLIAQFIAIEVDESGRPTKVVFTTHSIDEEKKQEEKLLQKSQTDELTGFYNRRAYEEEIHEIDDLANNFVYISLDVNGLKVVNDTLGHAAGDELIIGSCTCMKQALGSYGKLFRTGGDEFVAILYIDDTKLDSVLQDFEEATMSWSGKLVDSLTISYGYVTKSENPALSIHEIAVLADKRMYEAKTKHYQKSGMDRKGQSNAHVALCASYTKILKIDITNDCYQIVGVNAEEKSPEKGFAEEISTWLHGFAETGNVHPEDVDYYISHTSLDYLREYFKTSPRLFLFYRRKFDNGFRKCIMEISKTSEYTNEEQILYLYVKDIEQ